MKYLILLALSQAADLGSTAFGLVHGAHEMNPLVGFLMTGGLGAVLLTKGGIVVLAALIVVRAMRLGRDMKRTNSVLLWLSIFVLTIAALNMVSWI